MERIRLRTMRLRWEEDHSVRPYYVQGIALPDGRFIFGGNQTYSSEATMLRFNPGAELVWDTFADETINHVMPEDT